LPPFAPALHAAAETPARTDAPVGATFALLPPGTAEKAALPSISAEQDQRSIPSVATLAKEQAKAPDASSVRVETAKLDHLMNMVGEIVIAQSLIRHNQLLASTADSRLMGDLSQLARVTAEVQRATMSMRMVPVGQLFQRVERVIRDLSRKAGKLVTLETSGSETEIDKTVAEELSDPLLHMVRNSIDHGIETTPERSASGKNPEARIRLSAYHQGGQVIIKISDDGRGLNADRIRSKAEDRHLIPPNAQMTEEEIYQLIFEPGFSTAEKITDISGRGVGMDVVRRNVEKLRGRIETESFPGQGTAFLLKLPLTLAIIDGLVVEVGTEQYIIPLSGVREIFRPRHEALLTVQQRDEMMLVRDELMPVVRLNQRLGINARATELSDGLMVVVESENRCYCLMVDDLLGKQEVVIKSLGEAFKDLAGISGCAVLGNGRVGLILDTDGIYRGRKR
jgi:two-component system chemotaxis sensor kinase CheA